MGMLGSDTLLLYVVSTRVDGLLPAATRRVGPPNLLCFTSWVQQEYVRLLVVVEHMAVQAAS